MISSPPLPTVHSFFKSLIDYAGLFPPAALPLSEALKNYLAYRRGEHSWILGRFILTAAQLRELEATSLSENEPPLPLSLVTKNPALDLSAATNSLKNLSGRATVKSIEVFLDPSRPIEHQWQDLHKALSSDPGFDNPSLFFELAIDEQWEENLLILLNAMKSNHIPGTSIIGYKLRCGGAPHGAPSSTLVATALKQCAVHGVPLKFTAGLHQPFSHLGESETAYGFFNVFFAAFVANTYNDSADRLATLLSCSSSPGPRLDTDGISWQGYSLSASQIANLRATRVTSFGSCSFTEPTEESVRLTWLP